jgi:trimeric autotransporter adhesin
VGFQVKKSTGWTTVNNFHVKSPSGWKTVTKAFVKKATGWSQFWPKSGPNIDFPLEISSSSTSWPATLTGKNYHWENVSTLSYKFQSSLTNTTDNGSWTDLMSYTSIPNPAEGSFNISTFSITSANFSTTIRSKWFRFVVRATDSSSGITNIEYSNTVNISKSTLVGTAGTVTIARDSATSYVYRVTNNGTWSDTPVSYSYQWQQLLGSTWTDISGATSISQNMSSYTGKDIRCKVFAVDDLGATSELPIISNSLFVDFAPPTVTSFTATGGVSKIVYSYVVTSDNQFPTIKLKIERLQSGGSYLQTNLVDLTAKTGTDVVQSISQAGTYRATLTASDGINPDSSIVVNNLIVANLNRSNVAIAQTTTGLSGPSNITFSNVVSGSTQRGTIGWTNGSGVQTSDISWTGNYSGSELSKAVSGTTQSSSFLLSRSTGNASITATVVQKALPQATISWNQTSAQSYRVIWRATSTIAPGGSIDYTVNGNSSASSVSLIVNAASATVRVLRVIVYEYENQNSGQPTGSVVGDFDITSPNIETTLGASQNFSESASGTIDYNYAPVPTITISNVTTSSFTATWSAAGATAYNVDIFRTSTAVSVPGYPLNNTTNTTATPSGLSPNVQYTVSVASIIPGDTSSTAPVNVTTSSITTTTTTTTAAPSYTLTVNCNSGTGCPASGTHSGSYTIPATNPTRSGFTFAGYDASCSGSFIGRYSAGQTILCTGTIVLSAAWTASATTTTTLSTTTTTTTTTTGGGTTGVTCTSFDVSRGCCGSTGCSTGCGSGAICSNPAFNRCLNPEECG